MARRNRLWKKITMNFGPNSLKTQYVQAIFNVLEHMSTETLKNVLDLYPADMLTAEEMSRVFDLFNYKVPERLLNAFVDGVNWKRVCCVQPIVFNVSQVDDEFMMKLSKMCENIQRPLYSESFLLYHANRLDYKQLSKHTFVSELVLNGAHPDQWDWRFLNLNKHLSTEFVLRHAKRFNWTVFTATLFNSERNWNTIDSLIHLINWDVATKCCSQNNLHTIRYFDQLNIKLYYATVSYCSTHDDNEDQLLNMIVSGVNAGKFAGPNNETINGWQTISAWEKTPWWFLLKHAAKIDWSLVCYKNIMCLDKIESYIDWNKLMSDLIQVRWNDERFLLRHIDNGHISWEQVSTCLNLNEYIMSKYVDHLVWDKLPRDRRFTSLFLQRHRYLSKAYNLKKYLTPAPDTFYDTSRVDDFKWVCNFAKNKFPRCNIEQALKNINCTETLLIFIESFIYKNERGDICFAFPRVDSSQFTESERKRVNQHFIYMSIKSRRSEKAYVKLVKKLPTLKYVKMFFTDYAWLDLSTFVIELEELL
ncbi:ORF-100 [Buzura suppressaria nucleopolyhedrovirus]|uniref:ORF-100 n=1 Tax=Buzura suppressaria nuclear polyhedrosis virus TaxID=74320 RepID=W5VLC4_NPVBS|nr:ORF-100 [Buzura suppressaria nucleopolyhedrovirus]AHH82689.1 ORF-100 [Buzura suppressaria nucleopolyhedrovirus]AKN91073.1 ORF-103 [Buzura suppressaria nucleopolyhedrovirus]